MKLQNKKILSEGKAFIVAVDIEAIKLTGKEEPFARAQGYSLLPQGGIQVWSLEVKFGSWHGKKCEKGGENFILPLQDAPKIANFLEGRFNKKG